MDSFDELLRQAEGLDRNARSFTSRSVAASRLMEAFSELQKAQETTLDGRLLLAQEKMDVRGTELKLDAISNQGDDKPAETEHKPMRRYKKREPLTGLERMERRRQDRCHEEWRENMRNLTEMIAEESAKSSESQTKLFSVHYDTIGLTNEALIHFANAMSIEEDVFASPRLMIEQVSKAHCHLAREGDRTFIIRSDFCRALKMIFSGEEFTKALEYGVPKDNPETVCGMIGGSLKFLMNQFSRKWFRVAPGREVTQEDVERVVARRWPDAQAPWPHIWMALRSGLIPLALSICNNIAHKNETSEFVSLIKTFVLEKREPDQELSRHLVNRIEPANPRNSFKARVYSYVVGFGLSQSHPEIINTVEDYVFMELAPLRFLSRISASSIITMGNILAEESKKTLVRGSKPEVRAMILALCLDFNAAVEALLEMRLIPVEAMHWCMIMKCAGVWDGAQLPQIASDFVQLLPKEMVSTAVDYLAFTGDSKRLVDFLVAQDPTTSIIDLAGPGKERAVELIKREVSENPWSISTLHSLLICGDYDSAVRLFTGLASDVSLRPSNDELAKVVHLCSVMLSKMKGNVDGYALAAAQNAGLRMTLSALSVADVLPQSERKLLIESFENIDMLYESSAVSCDELREVVRGLSVMCNVLILFDEGRPNEAVALACDYPCIIPKVERDINAAVELCSSILPSLSAVVDVSIRLCSHISAEMNMRNRKIYDYIIQFAQRIPLSDHASHLFAEIHRRTV